MQEHFRLGIFTSSSVHTMNVAQTMLEEAAEGSESVFDRSLILHRIHTKPVQQHHIKSASFLLL